MTEIPVIDNAVTRKATIPGPPPINSIFQLLPVARQISADPLAFMKRLNVAYGDFYRVEIQGQPMYVTSNPDAIHDILVTHAGAMVKDNDYRDEKQGLARFFGYGLLTSNGDFWKRQRKLVAPALHTKRIAAYADTMTAYTSEHLTGWQDGARLDISREMNAITMKIVAKALFNASVASDIRILSDALRAVQEVFTGIQLIPTWVPTPRELRARQAGRDLDAFVYRLINEWRTHREDRGDLLSMLLLAEDEDGNHMTDKQARDEILTLFLAGHETTANTLNWTWMLLAQHPEVEAKLHHELDTVLHGRVPTLDDLKDLPYTTMIVKESMRLYPPAWSIGREATEDVEINGYPVARGSTFQVFIYGAHHHPDLWDQPEAFIPERFSPENEVKIPKHAYLPFGGGPRICIGNAFAMMEAPLILATIAQRYTLRLQPGQQVEPAAMITLFPKQGLPMTVHRRNTPAARIENTPDTALPTPVLA